MSEEDKEGRCSLLARSELDRRPTDGPDVKRRRKQHAWLCENKKKNKKKTQDVGKLLPPSSASSALCGPQRSPSVRHDHDRHLREADPFHLDVPSCVQPSYSAPSASSFLTHALKSICTPRAKACLC